MSAGKLQRNPANGKRKRKTTNGKRIRNTAMNTACCCGGGGGDCGEACEYCTGTTPATISAYILVPDIAACLATSDSKYVFIDGPYGSYSFEGTFTLTQVVGSPCVWEYEEANGAVVNVYTDSGCTTPDTPATAGDVLTVRLTRTSATAGTLEAFIVGGDGTFVIYSAAVVLTADCCEAAEAENDLTAYSAVTAFGPSAGGDVGYGGYAILAPDCCDAPDCSGCADSTVRADINGDVSTVHLEFAGIVARPCLSCEPGLSAPFLTYAKLIGDPNGTVCMNSATTTSGITTFTHELSGVTWEAYDDSGCTNVHPDNGNTGADKYRVEVEIDADPVDRQIEIRIVADTSNPVFVAWFFESDLGVDDTITLPNHYDTDFCGAPPDEIVDDTNGGGGLVKVKVCRPTA